MIHPSGLNLHGAIFASNPPTGLTGLNGDASTDNTARLQGMFDSLPHANTNTRTIYISRPSNMYKLNSTVNITENGTQVHCDGTYYYTLRVVPSGQSGSYNNDGRTYFLGHSQSPMFRFNSIDYATWVGLGAFVRQDFSVSQSYGHIALEMNSCNFSHVSVFFVRRSSAIAEIYAESGFSDHCGVDSGEARDTQSNDSGVSLGVARIAGRTNSGTVRGCWWANCYVSALQDLGVLVQRAQDCMGFGGTSEYNTGTPGDRGYTIRSPASRFVGLGCGEENEPFTFWFESGTSGFASLSVEDAFGPGDGYDWSNS